MNRLLLILLIPFLFAGCSPTKFLGAWSKPGVESKSYQNLGIVVLTPNLSTKTILESELAEALIAEKIRALATFDIFPFAGRQDLVEKFEIDQDSLRQYMKKRLDKFDIDGLLVVSLLNTQKETRYTQSGPSMTLGMPVYGQTYWGYYSHVYTTVHSPGYYTTTATYFVESNVYDVASEELIWSGQTRTKNPSSVSEEAKNCYESIKNGFIILHAIVPTT